MKLIRMAAAGPVFAIAIALLACVSSRAQAQAADGPLGDYTITTWSETDGLPGGRIHALTQDEDGFLWVATDAGLVRFDGVRFEAWGTRGEPRLPVGRVTALMSARDGSLWIGVNSRMPIGRIRDNAVTLYGEKDGFGGSYVLSLIEDSDGAIWAGTFRGLFRFLGDRWQKVGADQGLDGGSVLTIFEDSRRRLWAATATAVFRRDQKHGQFERVDEIAISSNVWQSFSEDSNGTVWITDFKEGFRSSGGPTGHSSRIHRRGWGVELLHDRRRNFWVGTQGQGLWRTRETDGGAKLEMITVEDGLASNAVQSLLEDREGNVWVGTLAGLQRLTPHRVTPVRNLPIPRAIAVTPDGSVWVGTAGGLVRFSRDGRQTYTEADGLPGTVVLALHAEERGDLWVSTERGVARFSHGRFSPLLMSPGDRIQRVLGIAGAGDTLWVRDFHTRIFRWRGGRLEPADAIPVSHRRAASTIYSGTSGNLWIGSGAGKVGVRSRDGKFQSYELGVGTVVSIFEDAAGATWVGGDAGLSRLADGRFVTVNAQNGFPGGVKSIVEDQMGLMWIGTDSGIVRLEPDEIEQVAADPTHRLHFRLFNTADGVTGVPFNEGAPSALRDPDGRLWFLASGGVTIVDPQRQGDPAPPPRVRIESVTADAHPLDTTAAIRLAPGTSHLHIGFTALTLSDPMRVRFRYRLDGFDHDWVDAGSTRQASYTNLPPREYHFRVMASAGDATWGKGAELGFGLEPAFYETSWFYVACGLTSFLIVFGSWRLHVRQVRRQFALVLAERIRMSRAIHDTLLQGLAGLALQVDDLSHDTDLSLHSGKTKILRIRRQVENHIRQARRSILDLRTPMLASRTFPQALREAAELAIAGRHVRLNVNVRGTPHPCSSSVEEQLLLIGQEAINNAVLHGQTSQVIVEIDYGNEGLRLRVTDDGCGFDPETAQQTPGHYGLSTMRERAEQVRGRLTIVSAPGSGTEVETVVPT